jgi:osmotically-inducible protein OsmY
MTDRDYRWRDERNFRRPGGERDFYLRDEYGEDDYGGGYGEQGMTNYGLVRDRNFSGGYGGRRDIRGDRSRDYGDFSSDNEYGSRYGRSVRDLSRARRDWNDNWGDETRYRNEDRGFWDRASDEVASWFGDDDAQQRRRLDARHQGRGPKGYRRSDDRIREDLSDRLTDDPFIDASDVEIEVKNAEVTLTGSVDSRSARRRVEDLAERVSGVTHVQNNLRVTSASEATREERETGRSKSLLSKS